MLWMFFDVRNSKNSLVLFSLTPFLLMYLLVRWQLIGKWTLGFATYYLARPGTWPPLQNMTVVGNLGWVVYPF